MTAIGGVEVGDVFAFYGLLKRGAARASAHFDPAAAGDFEGPCWFRGDMFDLGGYPGVISGNGLCEGERWRVRDVSIVPDLDAFEDVTDDPATSLYQRVRIELLSSTGMSTGETAWIYRYNRSVAGLRRVTPGIWPVDAVGEGR